MTKMADNHMFVKGNMPLEKAFDFSSEEKWTKLKGIR